MADFSVCEGHYQNPFNPMQRYHLEHQFKNYFLAVKTTEASAGFPVMMCKRNEVIGFQSMISPLFIPFMWREVKKEQPEEEQTEEEDEWEDVTDSD